MNNDLVDVTDFLPTMLDAAGAETPEGYLIDGRSFYPQLKGEKGDPKEWIFFHYDPMTANRTDLGRIRFVRDHDWKLYETGELYDLNADIDEELPIFESDDGPVAAAARAKLKPVFAEMGLRFGSAVMQPHHPGFAGAGACWRWASQVRGV